MEGKKYRCEIEGTIDEFGDVRVGYISNSGCKTYRWLNGAGNFFREHGEKIPEPVFYKVGDTVKDNLGDEAMIFQVGRCGRCCLVQIADGFFAGNRYRNPINVKDTTRITQKEFDEMSGNSYAPFTKIED